MDVADWDARYSADGLLWSSQPNRFLVSEVSELAPGSALDVACGEGRNALWLASRGWQVTAVDQSEVGVDKGRALAEKAGLDVTWVVDDVTRYHSEDRYDLVAAMYLHLPRTELRAAFALAQAAVAPGGTLLIVGHHSDNIEDGVGGPQRPDILYTADDVTAMLADFTIVKAERLERPVEGASRPALDALVRAVRP